MPQLVLVRHGQSQWNLENRFTGWWDVDLSEKGVAEARAAGKLLRQQTGANIVATAGGKAYQDADRFGRKAGSLGAGAAGPCGRRRGGRGHADHSATGHFAHWCPP